MSEEILINITPMETRVALVENGVLQEVHIERTQRRGIVGIPDSPSPRLPADHAPCCKNTLASVLAVQPELKTKGRGWRDCSREIRDSVAKPRDWPRLSRKPAIRARL